MNYFANQSAAEWYARSRPYFHPFVVGKIGEKLGFGSERRIETALDVGCGTGQSSVALAEIAQMVAGTEISSEMLAVAMREERVRYVRARAEELPVADEAVGLVTVALAFHWFERERFLAEARRVLKPSGWLVIYNDWWTGEMRENPSFEDWTRGPYITRYPSPPRDRRPPAENIEQFGFEATEQERFTHNISFSMEEVAGYLMTQSNVIAGVEERGETEEKVYGWLVESLTPFFGGTHGTFVFGGAIDYFRKLT